MLNVPSDNLSFFFIRMDLLLIESSLDDEREYIGMPFESFIDFLRTEFEAFEKAGDTKLHYVKGSMNGDYDHNNLFYTFVGNNSRRPIPLVLEKTGELIAVDFHPYDNFTISEEESSRGILF